MALLPLNARSDLVTSTNCSEGGVLDSIRRFHTAWPASILPARRPTRGSGLGAEVDLLCAGDGPPPSGDEVERAQAPVTTSVATSESDEKRMDAIGGSLRGCGLSAIGYGSRVGRGIGW